MVSLHRCPVGQIVACAAGIFSPDALVFILPKKAFMANITIAVGCLTRPLTDRLVYTNRNGVARGMKRRGGLGWLKRPESTEERYVREMNVLGKVVYDVGAFEGLYTLRFARDAKRVVTFEPHPWCQQRTAGNVALNGFTNVSIVPVALSDECSLMPLAYPPREPARSTINAEVADRLASAGYDLVRTSVLCWRMDDAVESLHLPAPNLIKIDAEGAETAILRGAERTIHEHRPELYIELHGTRDAVDSTLQRYKYDTEMIDDDHIHAVPRSALRD